MLFPRTWNNDSLIVRYSFVVWITSNMAFRQVRRFPTSASLSKLILIPSLYTYLPSNIVKNSTGDVKATVNDASWRYSMIGLNTLAISVSRSFGLFTFIARATTRHTQDSPLQKATQRLLRVVASVALVASWYTTGSSWPNCVISVEPRAFVISCKWLEAVTRSFNWSSTFPLFMSISWHPHLYALDAFWIIVINILM